MAQRRMFSKDITENDAFLDMPLSTQSLYFHLGMQADDDGFVSPNRIVRMLGCQPDDLKILIAKKFVLPFEDGVVVIKHWRINNYIQKDRYKATTHQENMALLKVKGNGGYKLDTECIQNVRAGKVSKGKVSKGKVSKSSKTSVLLGSQWNNLIDNFETVNPMFLDFYKNKTERRALEDMAKRWGYEKLLNTILALPEVCSRPYAPKITSPTELKRDIGKLVLFMKQEGLKAEVTKNAIADI